MFCWLLRWPCWYVAPILDLLIILLLDKDIDVLFPVVAPAFHNWWGLDFSFWLLLECNILQDEMSFAFSRSFPKLGSFGFNYINGSYIWKYDLSWDLILKVFNSKTVTSSDKCTWVIIIPEGAKTARHYIFHVVIHQPRASFFLLSCLDNSRNTDLMRSCLVVWFRCLFYPFIKYV